ncbi:unnamed protein product, partial [Oppiella nova]
MTTRKLTVLFTPLNGWAHINASHGLAEELKRRGHRVVFAVDKAFKGKLLPFGFEECIHGLKVDGDWPQVVKKIVQCFKEEPIVIVEKFLVITMTKMFADNKEREAQYKEIIEKVKPDLIVTDNYVNMPTITNCGIPWVWLYAAAVPFALNDDDRIPPPWAGLPLHDRKDWAKFRERRQKLYYNLHKQINEYTVEKGAPKLVEGRLHPLSPYLNIYFWPKEFEYSELQPMSDNWVRVESFIRTTNDTFDIPAQLQAHRPAD